MNVPWKAILFFLGLLTAICVAGILFDAIGSRRATEFIAKIQDAFGRLETENIKLRDGIDRVGEAVGGLSKRLDGLEGRIDKLTGSVADLRGSIRESRNTLSAISGDVSGIEGANAEFSKILAELTNQLTNTE